MVAQGDFSFAQLVGAHLMAWDGQAPLGRSFREIISGLKQANEAYRTPKPR